MALSKMHTSAEFNFFLYIEDWRSAILKRSYDFSFFNLLTYKALLHHFVATEDLYINNFPSVRNTPSFS